MSVKRIFEVETKKEIVKLYIAEMQSIKKIAKEYKANTNAVARILKEQGVKLRKKGNPAQYIHDLQFNRNRNALNVYEQLIY